MTRFAVFCPPYRGHLDPMLALGRRLLARGHHLTVVAQADAEPLVAGSDLGFAPVTPAESLARRLDRLGRTRGLLGIGGVIRATAATTDRLCQDSPAILHRLGAEAVLADQTEAAGGLVARHLGLPLVSVANALLINTEPGVPPPFLGWRYDPSEAGRRRNLGGYRVAEWAMRPLTEIVTRYDRLWRLGGLETIEDCASPLLQLSQTVRGLDFPRTASPPSLVHVGPLRDVERGEWRATDRRPRVFFSLGTLQKGRLALFRKVAEACRDLDLALVAAHGGKLTDAEAASLPGAPEAAAFLPQRQVIAGAAAVVTHGGLNTVLDALAAGVPLVVVPLAFEQGAIAARVERSGAGLVIPPRRFTAARLRAALARLLSDPGFKRRAEMLAREIATAGGVGRAADLVEAALAQSISAKRMTESSVEGSNST